MTDKAMRDGTDALVTRLGRIRDRAERYLSYGGPIEAHAVIRQLLAISASLAASLVSVGIQHDDETNDDLTRSAESLDHPASVSTRPPAGKA